MTIYTTSHQCDALILAVDESSLAVGAALIRLASGHANGAPIDWPMLVVNNAGDALRRVHHADPHALFVCVRQLWLERTSALIDSVRQRRPQLPQFAVTETHDEDIERAVRSAGAAYYFALGAEADETLLCRTLEALGVLPVVQASHSGLSPPPRARPFASPRSPSVKL